MSVTPSGKGPLCRLALVEEVSPDLLPWSTLEQSWGTLKPEKELFSSKNIHT
jgi:hypothetical protein